MARIHKAALVAVAALALAGCGNLPDPQAKLDEAKEKASQKVAQAYETCMEKAQDAGTPVEDCDRLAESAENRLDEVPTVSSP